MTASALLTARPLRAAIAWATREALFVEYPTKDGSPYITRFPLTPEGLRLALNVLLDKPDHSGPQASAETKHPAVRRLKPIFDDAERQGVRDVLKKLGVT